MLSILISCIKPTLIVTSAYERERECENARELNTIVSQLVRPKVALINYENRIVITFNGSPMEAVSYVSVVLDACEWSPSPLIL